MKPKIALQALALITLAGCSGSPSKVMGAPPSPTPVTLVSNVKPAGSSAITVQGTMIEKCPVAGCWFKLRDKTGVIKIDTKSAGFVVSEVPLNTEVIVSGVPKASGEPTITATGMRY
jgi:uncharacterized protein YdeI (BOF family)